LTILRSVWGCSEEVVCQPSGSNTDQVQEMRKQKENLPGNIESVKTVRLYT
jgi:hypothetical protein